MIETHQQTFDENLFSYEDLLVVLLDVNVASHVLKYSDAVKLPYRTPNVEFNGFEIPSINTLLNQPRQIISAYR